MGLSPAVKHKGMEANHSLPTSAYNKNAQTLET
jgi:hypothetical protein